MHMGRCGSFQVVLWLWVAAWGSARADDPDLMVPRLVVEHEMAHDDGAAADLSQMVLSVGKRLESVQESASIVTVVTREQIVARGYRTVSDILNDLPGFEAYRPMQLQHTDEAMVRGNARTLLVLWNGVPLNSPQDNRRPLGYDLPLSVVDRVEILSGPGGVLWGASAFLGIVNITTLRVGTRDSRAELSAGVGGGRGAQAAGYASASVAQALFAGQARLFANVTLYTSRDAALRPAYDALVTPFGPPDTDATFTFRSSLGDTTNARDLYLPLTLAVDVGPVRLDLFYPLVSRQFREFNTFAIRTDYAVDSSGVRTKGGASSRLDERVALVNLQVSGTLGARTHVVGRVYATGFENVWPRDVAFGLGETTQEALITRYAYEGDVDALVDGAYRLGTAVDATQRRGAHHVISGAEVYLEGMHEIHRRLTAGLVLGGQQHFVREGNRLILSAFAQDKLALGQRLQLAVGLRGQYVPSAYDPLLLGSVAVLYSPLPKLYLKLNVAQGFRPPPLVYVLANDDPTTNPLPHRQANPDLRAERSVAVEADLSAIVLKKQRRVEYVALRLGYQLTRIDDLVVLADSFSVNAGRREMHSVEARAEAMLEGHHRVTFAYGSLRGYDAATGPLRHVANHKLHVGLEARPWRRVSAMIAATSFGPEEDLNRLPVTAPTSATERVVAPPSSVVVDRIPPVFHARAGVRLEEAFGLPVDAAVFVQNLFDVGTFVPDQDFDKREAPIPLPAAGRSVTVTLTGRL
jgi:outer membrane receptor protein involved in Fe transport